jgi:Flp pilus assembly protein TadD
VDVIDYGVMVYRGYFQVPLLSALSHAQQVNGRLRVNDVTGALADARAAEALAPTSARVLAAVGQALEASGDAAAAADYYRRALAIANTTPEFQVAVIADLQRRLAGK